MNVTVDGKPASVPYDGADHVITEERCECGGVQAVGMGDRETGHDYIEETSRCCACSKTRGKIRVTFSTIFGIEEDERVTRGRARCY